MPSNAPGGLGGVSKRYARRGRKTAGRCVAPAVYQAAA
jgi:hypothetical protein